MKEAKDILLTTMLVICIILSITSAVISIRTMMPQKINFEEEIVSGDTLVIDENQEEQEIKNEEEEKEEESGDSLDSSSTEELLNFYTITSVNIRQGPSTEDLIVKTVPINTLLMVIAETATDTWSKVKIDNNYFFVYNEYISKEKTITTEQLNENKQNSKEESSDNNENFLGYFTLTYYCPCSKCCGQWASGITASGTTAEAGRTIATSNKYAFGTKMNINGHIYTVEDRGGAIKGNKIDIYVNSHSEALKLGKQTNVPVYLVN